jgi:hypothetical protein
MISRAGRPDLSCRCVIRRAILDVERVHQNDLVGYLQEQGGFEVLNLPAIVQRPQTFDLGDGRTYTRQYGELLHPSTSPPMC